MLAERRSIRFRNSELNHFLRDRRFSRRESVFLLLGFISVFGWAYIIFASEAFIIKGAEATGLQSMDQVELTKEVFSILDHRPYWRPWSGRHAWFIDTHALQNSLQERLFAQNVTVIAIEGGVLKMAIQERSKRLILHSRQQYAWIDLHGVVTNELSPEEKRDAQALLLGQRNATTSEAPIIKQNLDELVSVGFTIGEEKVVKEWLSLRESIVKSGLIPREIEPPLATSTQFTVLADTGELVVFDMTSPIDLQTKTYLDFKRTKEGQKTYDSVDVRVPGRVYVKE